MCVSAWDCMLMLSLPQATAEERQGAHSLGYAEIAAI